jgi:CheY-like chemotaxis protein
LDYEADLQVSYKIRIVRLFVSATWTFPINPADIVTDQGIYEEELETEGYEVITATNGKEAIQKLEEDKPDLVVLDIVMPVMDGMEALGRILGKDRKIPIILNTSYPGYREDFMSWAADAYVTKSSDLGGLKRKIKELLTKGRSQ